MGHLNWKRVDVVARQHQALVLHKWVTKRQKELYPQWSAAAETATLANGFPPIISGDFNAYPTSDSIRFMEGKHAVNGIAAFYYDTLRYVNAKDRVTWSKKCQWVADEMQDIRLDYTFIGLGHE